MKKTGKFWAAAGLILLMGAGLCLGSCSAAGGELHQTDKTFSLADDALPAEENAGPGPQTADVSTPAIRVLTIGTADRGGTMYPVGETIADIITEQDARFKVNLSASNGSASNTENLMNGQIDLGLVSGDVAYAAYHGEGEFSDHPARSLRAIAAVYSSLSNWITLDSSGIRTLKDLKGKTVSIGPENSTTELSAVIALDAAGLSSKNLNEENYGLGSGSQALADGKLDAVHGLAGAPIPSFLSLSESEPIRLIPYTDAELDKILTENPYYYRETIPAGTYAGQTEDIATFGVKCILCADVSMNEDEVYRITELLYEAAPRISVKYEAMGAMSDESFLHENLPIPLHPGAEKFYREAAGAAP